MNKLESENRHLFQLCKHRLSEWNALVVMLSSYWCQNVKELRLITVQNAAVSGWIEVSWTSSFNNRNASPNRLTAIEQIQTFHRNGLVAASRNVPMHRVANVRRTRYMTGVEVIMTTTITGSIRSVARRRNLSLATYLISIESKWEALGRAWA